MTTLATSEISNAERHEIRRIIAAVVEATGVTVESMTSRSRTARVAAARQLAMTLIREGTMLSLAEIGSLFERDHGTVIHAIKATRKRNQTDPAAAGVYAGAQRNRPGTGGQCHVVTTKYYQPHENFNTERPAVASINLLAS